MNFVQPQSPEIRAWKSAHALRVCAFPKSSLFGKPQMRLAGVEQSMTWAAALRDVFGKAPRVNSSGVVMIEPGGKDVVLTA